MTGALRVVRALSLVSLVMGLMRTSVLGQEQPNSMASESLERIHAALARPQLVTTGAPSLFDGTKPDERHFGGLTFLPPDTAGEFVRVRVPVGAIVSRAARSVAASQHHRAETSAHDDVVRALAAWQQAQAK
jgi:hypothetical protein